MADNETVDTDTSNSDEALESLKPQTGEYQFDTVEEATEAIKQRDEQNKKLFERAKKAEAKAKLIKVETKPDTQETTTTETPAASAVDDKKIERLELKIDGYSEDEVDFIMANGGRAALSSPLVKTAIEASREKANAEKKSEDASPESSPKSPVFKQYTQEQMANMSSDELEKILPHAE